MSSPGAIADLTLVTRAECSLCDELRAQIEALRSRYPVPPLALVDVDADPVLLQRFGRKVPVLLLGGVPVCSGRLDSAELLRLLRL